MGKLLFQIRISSPLVWNNSVYPGDSQGLGTLRESLDSFILESKRDLSESSWEHPVDGREDLPLRYPNLAHLPRSEPRCQTCISRFHPPTALCHRVFAVQNYSSVSLAEKIKGAPLGPRGKRGFITTVYPTKRNPYFIEQKDIIIPGNTRSSHP